MKHCFRIATLIILFGHVALATAAAPAALDRVKVISAASDIIKQAHFCTLVTIGADGQPNARIVTPAPPDENLEIWISTSRKLRKIAELRKDRRATLLYFDPVNLAYVTLVGDTTLLSDAAAKEKHWQPEWAAFYPREAKNPDLIMIKFVPRRVEIVSRAHKLLEDPWGLAVVELK